MPCSVLWIQEARSSVHHLWSLGSWSYSHPNIEPKSILMRLQHSDPICDVGVDVVRSAINLEPLYRVTMLIREEWTRGPRQ
jgi:hypothetical protein